MVCKLRSTVGTVCHGFIECVGLKGTLKDM